MLLSSERFDWKNSKAHLLLLSKFISAQEASYFAKSGEWDKVLRESPEKAIRRFVDEGVLTRADLAAVLSYKYNASELRDLLKQRKLAVSGAKAELVQRLIQADKEGTMKLASGSALLTCTEAGRKIAEQYLASEKNKRIEVEQRVIGSLANRMFEEASSAVANYEAEQVFSRGMGIDWKHYDHKREVQILNSIFNDKPEIVCLLGDAKLEPLRIAAAMMALWGESKAGKWLPLNLETES